MTRASVIGAGSWGTAFSGLVATHVDELSLWCHGQANADTISSTRKNSTYLSGYTVAENVVATASLADAVRDTDLCVVALPSTYIRAISHELARVLDSHTPVLVLTKGIEPGTKMLMSEVVADELDGPERIAALCGPNHAEEVCRAVPAAAVIAGPTHDLARTIRPFVATPEFRVYISDDIRGIEVCAAVKNVIALACGMCAGIGYGDNTLALIMTRGLAEIGRMVQATGGNPLTCMGLAGMGDLIATCTSEHSRNRRFGEAVIAGATLEQFEHDTHMIVEGAHAVISVRELAQAYKVDVPIADAVWGVLYNSASVESMATVLMDRVPTEEFYGLDVQFHA